MHLRQQLLPIRRTGKIGSLPPMQVDQAPLASFPRTQQNLFFPFHDLSRSTLDRRPKTFSSKCKCMRQVNHNRFPYFCTGKKRREKKVSHPSLQRGELAIEIV
ncbi:hypothetical protein TWF225_007285 [Orbilia oligospora]|uniref:Uncharacterized protein n=1 Tax=Orbilia oligospora TaxID=2813651 RepID=A0A8H2HWN2_ORBOL|nr:hypothetical protein TWF225_007285 [Orbilia oligospora]KAF3238181.1 hypothetical protein TWF128_000688 [Orbilia oligospora]KAF3241761.1 hypothetical protein TWF217_011933 [Orbilia oligospora]KAF3295682.1 hypothetical protein TWF132_001010 [Orbilia oligospora]TGJ71492.1 hypothetical protein EYR41_003454 [Orbilia oligospora]